MNTSQCQRPRVKSDRPVKPLLPVQVTGALITGIGTGLADLFQAVAILEIEDSKELTSYWCGASTDGEGHITSIQLQKFATGEKYELPADLSSCSCPDGIYRSERPGGCRHAIALRQSLVNAVK